MPSQRHANRMQCLLLQVNAVGEQVAPDKDQADKYIDKNMS